MLSGSYDGSVYILDLFHIFINSCIFGKIIKLLEKLKRMMQFYV